MADKIGAFIVEMGQMVFGLAALVFGAVVILSFFDPHVASRLVEFFSEGLK